MGDDQSKARQTYSWCENLRIVKSLRTSNLAAASEAYPISGVFAQLSSWMCVSFDYRVLKFVLCLRVAFLPPS